MLIFTYSENTIPFQCPNTEVAEIHSLGGKKRRALTAWNPPNLPVRCWSHKVVIISCVVLVR